MNKECKHISEKIPGSQPDFHSKDGKESFLADKLRCKFCHAPWCDVDGPPSRRGKPYLEECKKAREAGLITDLYPLL